MNDDRKHPAPSPEGHDPHPAREETAAETSPESDHHGSPRMARELEDDRKLNGYVHDGKRRTGGNAEHISGPVPPDARERSEMTERGGDGHVHETPELERQAHDEQALEEREPLPVPPLRMPPD